jgi:primosomal protein N' (replication factor Y)
MNMNKFAKICLRRRMPEKLATLDYKIPEDIKEKLKKGSFVKVPLRKSHTEGVILSVTEEQPEHPTKDIHELIYDYPVLQEWQIKTAEWMSKYYCTTLQKCLQLFLPPKFYSENEIKKDAKSTCKKKFTLTDNQQKAFKQIFNSQKQTALLHGITGSGKTEVYLHLVEKNIKAGKQSILIVPEISLTPQMVNYFKRIFGNKVAILHSRLTKKEKSLEWLKIFLKKTPIIIGPRSAIFAPLKNPGIIILDEEHEFSYKQEQSPRYNTLTVIEKIAELTGAKVLLGSATPSVSTYHKAKNNEFELVELKERIGSAKLPNISIVDLREEFKKKNYSVLSEELQDKIRKTIKNNKQVILFLNKRGSASASVCRECGYMEKCESCDVPMTYHKTTPAESRKPALICHHCGLVKQVPSTCSGCGGTAIRFIGAGTQKVEEEVKTIFKDAKVARADRDTVSKKGVFEDIYNKFKNGETDILIGTQMIGKGLHFPGVDLVGVILADIGLHFPDFRSSERTFQLLTQVAGRAGRSDSPGEVIIQTYMPDNFAIKFSKENDYNSFFEYEIDKRKTFKYPPFSKLVKITCADINAKKALISAKEIYTKLKNKINENYILNIYPAMIFKMHNKYRWNILLQGENPQLYLENLELPANSRIDVDPVSIS